MPDESTTTSELEKLRDILYGNQARETSEQFKRLEQALEKRHRATNERIDGVRKELSQAQDKATKELGSQLQAAVADLSDQIEKLRADMTERIAELRDETQRRDDDLRQEFLALGAFLDDRKTNRQDLAEMLAEVSHRLLADEEAAGDDDSDDE